MSDKEENSLTEWTIFYAKNKDIIKREIKDYKIIKNNVEFEYRDRKHIYCIYPDLNDEAVSKSNEGWTTVVCNNTKSNLDFLVKNWDRLISNPKFSIIFVHPKSNNKWIIHPNTHNKIAEKESLKAGLLALAEEIPKV